MIEFTFLLLLLFQFKHFVCDYPLQNSYMLGKFMPGWEYLRPLGAHCAVHALFTGIIVVMVDLGMGSHAGYPVGEVGYLMLVDFCAHFAMDRIKASPKMLGRFKAVSGQEYASLVRCIKDFEGFGNSEMELAAKSFRRKLKSNTYFWWSLGLDQAMHHITHYYIIWRMVHDFAPTL
jgi:hypothetical protein